MDTELMARARAGLESWQRGDVSALEPLLDPDVELLWWKTGQWDCHGREAVLALLRERTGQRAGKVEVELVEAGEGILVVSRKTTGRGGPQAGTRPATLVTLRYGKVIVMRQFRSRDEALAAAK